MADLMVNKRYRGQQIEKFSPGDRITCTVATGQAVSGGRIVALDTGADRVVRHAGAGSLRSLGVAMFDVDADDSERKISIAVEGAWFLRAAGAIQAGDRVECAAAGAVRVLASIDVTGSLDPRAVVGTALADIADAADGPVLLGK